jgi:hypothetical protein
MFLYRHIVLLILALFCAQGCTDNSMKDRITQAIEQRCREKSECAIEMKTLTDFEWDRLVVFEVSSSDAEVSAALGFQYPDLTDLVGGLIFAHSGKIVHQEIFPYDPENPDRLSFELPGQINCRAFTPHNANFKVKKEILDGKVYYTMIPAS